MFDLLEIELTRVRRMADQADDGFLAYLIDLAILQANKRARSSHVEQETSTKESPRQDSTKPDR
jgi:hypothetical protein